jgi:hypothetical protein
MIGDLADRLLAEGLTTKMFSAACPAAARGPMEASLSA